MRESDLRDIIANKSQVYKDISGVYPNEFDSGMGEGSKIALEYLIK